MNKSVYGKNNHCLLTSFENLNLFFLIFLRKNQWKEWKIWNFFLKKIAEGDAYSAYSGPKSSWFYGKTEI